MKTPCIKSLLLIGLTMLLTNCFSGNRENTPENTSLSSESSVESTVRDSRIVGKWLWEVISKYGNRYYYWTFYEDGTIDGYMDSSFSLSNEVYRNEPVEEIEYIKQNNGRWFTENSFICFRYPDGRIARNMQYEFYNGTMIWQNVTNKKDLRQFKQVN